MFVIFILLFAEWTSLQANSSSYLHRNEFNCYEDFRQKGNEGKRLKSMSHLEGYATDTNLSKKPKVSFLNKVMFATL